MATAVLGYAGGIVGGYFGGPYGAAAGQFVGTVIGAYIDGKYTIPLLFGDPSGFTGPRLNDIQLQSGAEGVPVKFVLGSDMRIAGHIIALSDLIEVRSGDGGGKGGSSPSSAGVTYSYFLTFGVSWGEGQIRKVLKIWADAKIIYDDSATPFQASVDVPITAEPTGDIFSVTSGLDFRTLGLIVGQKIVVAGYSTPANNRTYTIKAISDLYFQVKEAVDTFEASTAATFTPQAVKDKRYTSITNYPGSATQPVDDVLAALAQPITGANSCPAYRDTAYSVIERLNLRDFGNRLPNMQALIEQAIELPVGQAITKIMQRARVDVAFDTTEVRGTIRGYVVSDTMSIAAQLEPIMLAYNVGVVEENGVLIFYSNGQEKPLRIDSTYLGSFEGDRGSDSVPRLFELEDTPAYDVPAKFEVTYLDPANNWQQGLQSERRINTTSVTVNAVDLAITMEANRARDIARRILYSSQTESIKCSLSLPGTYGHIQEGDLIVFTAYNNDWSVRVEDVERGANFLIKIKGVLSESNTYRSRSNADDGNQPPVSGPYVPGDLIMHLMDIPAMTESQVESAGLYYTMCVEDVGFLWGGAALYTSADNVTYVNVAYQSAEGTIGVTVGTLGSDAIPDVWDRKNTIVITLTSGELESRTEAEVLAGANRAVIGNEVIGFVTAEYLGADQYRISQLIRGVRDTVDKIATHVANERFILIDTSSVGFYDAGLSALMATRYYRGVPTDGVVAEYPAQSVILGGRTIKQFSPYHIEYTGAAAGNVVFTWKRRSRAITRFFGSYYPILHDVEAYTLEFWDAGVFKATYTVTAAETYTYSNAQRVTDFGYSPTTFELRISQVGPSGKGNEVRVTVNV